MIGLGLILISLAAFANAQLPGFGPCPNVPVMTTLDNGRMGGKWYTCERYYAFFDDGKCVSHYLLDVSVAQLLLSSSSDKSSSVESWNFGGTAMLGPSFPGQFVAVYYSPTTQVTIPIIYSIIETDYTLYAVGYSCADIGIANAKLAWIFTRDKFPDPTVLSNAYAVFDKCGIDRAPLTKVDHANCSWYH